MEKRVQDWRERNPYGVGYSGERVVALKKVCSCCRADFRWEGPESLRTLDQRCDSCAHHSRDADELAVLRDHDTQLPKQLEKAREMAKAARVELEERKRMDSQRRRQIASALQSRDDWKEVVDAIRDVHPPGEREHECGCGRKGCDVGPTIAGVRRDQRARELGSIDEHDNFDEWLARESTYRQRRDGMLQPPRSAG